MKFIDIHTQYAQVRDTVNQRIQQVLEHGQYVMGPEVEDLEQQLADFVGVSYCVTLSSGTDALLASLMALGVGRGDEVITTPFTFVATAEMIALLGAIPVFVDIDPVSYNISPEHVAAAITDRTKAILPVSLYGQCFAVDEIAEIAEHANLPVIEDGAQSFGASTMGRMSCSLTDIGCTSFFPSKPLGCYGDGGACFTQHEDLAKQLRQIRNHGQDRRYHHLQLGLNGRLDTLQAAILLAKLEIYEQEVALRVTVGQRYTQKLLDYGALTTKDARTGLLVPYIPEIHLSVYAQYTIQMDDRDSLVDRLQYEGIPTAVHYPVPLNEQPAFAHYPVRGDLSVSRRAAERVLSLPMHPYLAEPDQDRIVACIAEGCGLAASD